MNKLYHYPDTVHSNPFKHKNNAKIEASFLLYIFPVKTIVLTTILFLATSVAAYSQTPSKAAYPGIKESFLGSWEIAFPSNNNYLSKTSFAGGRFEYRHMLNRNISTGIAISWNSFEEYTSQQTYQRPDGTGAITTDLVRTVYTVPMTLTGHYYFSANKVKPYVGLGLGAQYADQTAYFNIYSIEETNWGFVIRPEAGLILPFNPQFGAFVSGAFNFSTNKSEDFNIDNLKHFSINIGFVFSTR